MSTRAAWMSSLFLSSVTPRPAPSSPPAPPATDDTPGLIERGHCGDGESGIPPRRVRRVIPHALSGAIGALMVAVIEAAFRTPPMPGLGGPYRPTARQGSAGRRTVRVPPVARRADGEQPSALTAGFLAKRGGQRLAVSCQCRRSEVLIPGFPRITGMPIPGRIWATRQRRLHHSVRPTPGPRKRARETLARLPAATSPPDTSRFPAPFPPAPKSPGNPRQNSGLPPSGPGVLVSARLGGGAGSLERTRLATNLGKCPQAVEPTACYVRTNDRSGVHRDGWIPDPSRTRHSDR